MDPVAVRHIAERLMGDFKLSLEPESQALRGDLIGTGASGDDAAASTGYIHGRSNLGEFHNTCATDLANMLRDIGFGYQALANVLASIAEDYQAKDENAGRDIAGTLPYFSPDQATQQPT